MRGRPRNSCAGSRSGIEHIATEGSLYRRDLIFRTARELAQEPERMVPDLELLYSLSQLNGAIEAVGAVLAEESPSGT
jgi:hypothetical protein